MKHVRYSAENNKKRGKSRILLKIAGLGQNREICCIRGIAISWRDRLVVRSSSCNACQKWYQSIRTRTQVLESEPSALARVGLRFRTFVLVLMLDSIRHEPWNRFGIHSLTRGDVNYFSANRSHQGVVKYLIVLTMTGSPWSCSSCTVLARSLGLPINFWGLAQYSGAARLCIFKPAASPMKTREISFLQRTRASKQIFR